MIKASVAAEAQLDKAARELLRVAAARPHLEARCERASTILVGHLYSPSSRIIKIAVRGGTCRFMVRGSRGSIYVVDPGSWRCSCPDYHRRDAACKHALACWALMRAAASPRPDPSPDVSGEAYTSSSAGAEDDGGEERRREEWRKLWSDPEAIRERVDRLPDPYPTVTARPMAECS